MNVQRVAAHLQWAALLLAGRPAPAAESAAPLHLTPLPVHAGGATPWAFSPAWFVLLALAMPVALWVGLAWRRAWQDDPNRLRRAARRELQRLLARMRRAGGLPRPVDLHAWCQAVARIWGVRVAAPTGQQLTHALRALEDDAAARLRWQALWRSAENGLYARQSLLPSDWMQTSAAAAGELRIPPRLHWLPSRLRHWLPLLALCGCAIAAGGVTDSVAATGASQSALPGLDARTASELQAVQGAAGQALHADWNNWAAHYDVALQQLVQGNAGYAAAHLTAAFLQHPSSGAVRDNLRWSLRLTGTMDPTLDRLLYGAWFQSFPVLLSPAGWQRLALVASLALGAGLCALVVPQYTAAPWRDGLRRARWALALGAVPLAVSILAWNVWGDLHRPNVGMLVESTNLSPIPTDLVTEQETQATAAGSLVLSQGAFLGWRRVRMVSVPGIPVGWTRAGTVMPLYATR